ncbi:hypothetical protein M501DRAFT_941926 [Patellaria atrata CBS 101060]|uniref:F-box domain-containing protein n=1 Tax=Patellaria atrata CBS 101060 TaxID=1346257 RepID=A0A9P4S5B6_9PEZI|nr:hypothetical protein M501DRAFT_941926 [Patellaria atrata CBS 101060]
MDSLNGTTPETRPAKRRDLPLNLIVLIISYLDDVADIARITRTSRLFYYMTLPRLYEKVTLRSYHEIRYNNGRPEGYGGGSPFSMGLAGLITKNFAGYVREWTLEGQWKESDLDDFSKGRVPDNSMMLNISVRAAMDKMTKLESFSWKLDTKPLHPIYQGLLLRPSLTSLTLRFPNTRTPRPTVLIPPMVNLRTFKALSIDPLCHPDDFSLLLLECKKLEHLLLHFSPRMRDMGEPSTSLDAYFGRCRAARHVLRLKSMELYNLYARHDHEMEHIISIRDMEKLSFVNCISNNDPMTVFIDNTWSKQVDLKMIPSNCKTMIAGPPDKTHAAMLALFSGLEKLYVFTPRRKIHSRATSSTDTPIGASPLTPTPPTSTTSREEDVSVASDYIAAITVHHGKTLRHLMLPDHWGFGVEVLTRLFESCPNLEQLAMGLDGSDVMLMRPFMKLVPRLFALRILIEPGTSLFDQFQATEMGMQEKLIAAGFSMPEYHSIRWLGIGTYVFELSRAVKTDGKNHHKGVVWHRECRKVSKNDVKHLEIWNADCWDF